MDSSGDGMIFDLLNVGSAVDRLCGAGVARFSHGLLVASAPTGTDSHSEWDPRDTPLHAGPDSLYISVRQAASGHVGVACVEGPFSPPGLMKLFSGDMDLPDASLVIYDPDGEIRLQLPVTAKRNRIDVYGDDFEESSQLWLVLIGRNQMIMATHGSPVDH